MASLPLAPERSRRTAWTVVGALAVAAVRAWREVESGAEAVPGGGDALQHDAAIATDDAAQ